LERKLCILGSTGSIGKQAIESATHLGYQITGISANSSVKTLEDQVRLLKPEYCAVTDENAAAELKLKIKDTNTKLIAGKHSPSELASICDADTVLNSIIGFAGLLPTLSAIEAGKNVALANKETLVSAGEIVMKKAREKGVCILPVDSEHCAIHQCISGNESKYIQKLILTASGGPFFGKTYELLKDVTPEQALKHPNWSMGRKLTIDSASLVNKGLELIEAMRLYDLPEDKIEIIVQRESMIHSMVEFVDSSILAQLAVPDMRLCIQYSLTYPEKLPGLTPRLDLTKVAKLTFFEVDDESFPAINLARKAARTGGIAPCVYNGANEACVDLFLKKEIKFTDITHLIESALDTLSQEQENLTLEDILIADSTSRDFIYKQVKNKEYGSNNRYI